MHGPKHAPLKMQTTELEKTGIAAVVIVSNNKKNASFIPWSRKTVLSNWRSTSGSQNRCNRGKRIQRLRSRLSSRPDKAHRLTFCVSISFSSPKWSPAFENFLPIKYIPNHARMKIKRRWREKLCFKLKDEAGKKSASNLKPGWFGINCKSDPVFCMHDACHDGNNQK